DALELEVRGGKAPDDMDAPTYFSGPMVVDHRGGDSRDCRGDRLSRCDDRALATRSWVVVGGDDGVRGGVLAGPFPSGVVRHGGDCTHSDGLSSHRSRYR